MRRDHFSTAEDCKTTLNIRVDWKRVLFRDQRSATLEDVLELTNVKDGIFESSSENKQRLDTLITRDKIWTTLQAHKSHEFMKVIESIRFKRLTNQKRKFGEKKKKRKV